MAKMTQIALAAILVVLFTLAESTTVTTVTTTIIEKKGGSQCEQQIMPQQMLSHCMMFISPMRSMNAQEEHLQDCCKQFKQIDRVCRCKAMKEMVMECQQMGQMGSRGMKQVVEDVMSIPSRCNIKMPQERCDIQSYSFDV